MRPWSAHPLCRPAIVLATSLVVPACATSARNEASTVADSDRDEARVAELEARIRQLETDLAATSGAEAPRTSVRVGTTGEVPADDEDVVPTEGEGGGSVVLRLHEERPADLPVVTERLAVVPMPATPVPAAPMVATSATSAPVPASTTVPVGPTPPPTSLAPLLAPQPAPVPATTLPSATDPDAASYRIAIDHLSARRFDAAIAAFTSFLRDHPGSARADDALYWRATSYYALHRYAEALVDYERVPRVAPRGEHAADAIYHSGLCHRRLGADERARAAFARVRRDYPDSVAANLAAREDTT